MGQRNDEKHPPDYYWSIMFKNGQIQNDIPFNTEGFTSAEVYPLLNENSCLILRNPDEFDVVKLNHLGDPQANIKLSE